VTTLRVAVGTIIGPIRVRAASELIIAASELISSASTAEMESKVGGGFETVEYSISGGVMAGERTGIESGMCSDCE
jgi:hypothetical protein